MKKFRWRLQRILDVKIKQEEMLRGELVALMEQTAALRGRIMMLEAMLRNSLREVAALDPAERLAAQRQFLDYVPVQDRQIAGLRAQLQRLEEQRKAKMDELIRLRTFRKSLEQLRTRAAAEHAMEMDRLEQKNLDENAAQALFRRDSRTV